VAPLVLEACGQARLEDAGTRDRAAARAEALGISYRSYALEILERGVYL